LKKLCSDSRYLNGFLRLILFLYKKEWSNVIAFLTFAHNEIELKVKHSEEESTFRRTTVDFSEYVYCKGYKVSIYISGTQISDPRFINVSFTKDGVRKFEDQFDFESDGKVFIVDKGSRIPISLIDSMVNFFEEVLFDSHYPFKKKM